MDTGDDGGGGGDMADVMDPSLMDIDTGGGGLMGPGGFSLGGQKKLANLKVQTLLALQELGIVIAVAFMVGGIFMLMIFVEKIWDQVMTAYQKKFGGYKENEYDVEDPAALVGTFKRYKNWSSSLAVCDKDILLIHSHLVLQQQKVL